MAFCVKDGGKLIFNHGHLGAMGELWKDFLSGTLRPFPRNALDNPLPKPGIADTFQYGLRPHSGVPKLQRLHVTELSHGLTVAAHAGHDGVLRDRFAESVVTARDDETRGQAFEVPLPWSGKCLVEIVDGKY